jgi:hypothetical protein
LKKIKAALVLVVSPVHKLYMVGHFAGIDLNAVKPLQDFFELLVGHF